MDEKWMLAVVLLPFVIGVLLPILPFKNRAQMCIFMEIGALINSVMVIFLLLNSLKVLQGERAQDIRSNITSYLVGFVEDNDIRTIREDFNKPWLAHQLEIFSAKQNIYRNCFAAVVDTGVETYETVYKVELPKDLSQRFKTRTTKAG